jgi:hypothetical protein
LKEVQKKSVVQCTKKRFFLKKELGMMVEKWE